jgi:gas vesicle protein
LRPPDRQGSGPIALWLAFAGGALLGGAVAVLLAPRSGAETRRRLAGVADGGNDFMVRLPEALREASEAAQAAFSEVLKS